MLWDYNSIIIDFLAFSLGREVQSILVIYSICWLRRAPSAGFCLFLAPPRPETERALPPWYLQLHAVATNPWVQFTSGRSPPSSRAFPLWTQLPVSSLHVFRWEALASVPRTVPQPNTTGCPESRQFLSKCPEQQVKELKSGPSFLCLPSNGPAGNRSPCDCVSFSLPAVATRWSIGPTSRSSATSHSIDWRGISSPGRVVRY